MDTENRACCAPKARFAAPELWPCRKKRPKKIFSDFRQSCVREPGGLLQAGKQNVSWYLRNKLCTVGTRRSNQTNPSSSVRPQRDIATTTSLYYAFNQNVRMRMQKRKAAYLRNNRPDTTWVRAGKRKQWNGVHDRPGNLGNSGPFGPCK